MAPTPLFHVTACNCLLHPATLTGGRIVLTYKWNPARALELIERERRHELLRRADDEPRAAIATRTGRRATTRRCWRMGGGGAPLQPDLVEKIDQSLEGGAPSTGYGLTETHGIVTANSARFFLAKPSSCGPVVPTLDAKLVDDDGTDLPAGPDTDRPAVRARRRSSSRATCNRPDATAEAIRDGWFNTGDIARIDEDGFVFIVDRAKDMVLRGGENVYCSEVEAAIYEHDAVAEAAVFGVPDERLGEDVGAVIVLRDGAELDADGLRAFLDGRIAKHKIPATIWFRDDPAPAQRQRQVPQARAAHRAPRHLTAPAAVTVRRSRHPVDCRLVPERQLSSFWYKSRRNGVSRVRRRGAARAWSTSRVSCVLDGVDAVELALAAQEVGEADPAPARRRGRRRSRAGGPRAASGRRARRTSGAGRG